MKVFIVLLVCLYLLSGCSNVHSSMPTDPSSTISSIPTNPEIPTITTSPFGTEPTSPAVYNENWYKGIRNNQRADWALPVVEFSDYIFYVSENGTYQYDKTTKKEMLLFSDSAIGLLIYEHDLYYHTETAIKQYCFQTKEVRVIWEYTDEPGFLSVIDFWMQEDFLYITFNGNRVRRIDLNTGISETFLTDTRQTLALGDAVYFIDHAERTFSLYLKNCKTNETVRLRGQGISEPPAGTLMIDAISNVGKDIFYITRYDFAVYKYSDDGQDEKIFNSKNTEASWMGFVRTTSANSLWFYETDGENLMLYEYTPSDDIVLQATFQYTLYECDIVVTDSAVFWFLKDEVVLYQRLNGQLVPTEGE